MALVATDNKHYKAIAEAIRENAKTNKKYTPADMAEGVRDAYWQGALDFGFRQTVEGKVISVSDVSNIEHNVGITLWSDTVTDFSTVKVTRCKKNLFDFYNEENWGLENEKRDVSVPFATEGGKQYTISFEIGNVFPDYMYLHKKAAGASSYEVEKELTLSSTDRVKNPYTFTAEEGASYRIWGAFGATQPLRTTVINFQIEQGDTASEYEKYQGKVYTPNSDGTVEGITSIAPSMVIITDNDNANIKCEYYADVNKKIESLTAQ